MAPVFFYYKPIMQSFSEIIRNRHGERLDYAFHPTQGEARGLVILGHGVTGNKDRPLLIALAEALEASGFSVLRFSFSGNGLSEGHFVDSCITKEVEDLGSVLDVLGRQPVTYMGHSMGAAVGVLRAAMDSRIGALVSLAGMVDTAGFASREFGDQIPDQGCMWEKSDCPLSSRYMNDLTAIGSVASHASSIKIPWLLVHGTEDDVVPLEDSLTMEPLAKSAAEIHAIDGADHVFDGAATGQMCRAVTEWIARKVAP